jgi:hypothetical protein
MTERLHLNRPAASEGTGRFEWHAAGETRPAAWQRRLASSPGPGHRQASAGAA